MPRVFGEDLPVTFFRTPGLCSFVVCGHETKKKLQRILFVRDRILQRIIRPLRSGSYIPRKSNFILSSKESKFETVFWGSQNGDLF